MAAQLRHVVGGTGAHEREPSEVAIDADQKRGPSTLSMRSVSRADWGLSRRVNNALRADLARRRPPGCGRGPRYRVVQAALEAARLIQREHED